MYTLCTFWTHASHLRGKGQMEKWTGKDEKLLKQLAQRCQNFIFLGEKAVWEQNYL